MKCLSRFLLVPALSLCVACDGEELADRAESALVDASSGAAKPKVKQPLVLVTGDKVTLPSVYKGLRLGMSGEEAKAVFPAMPEDDTIRVAEHPDVYFVADFDKDSGRISRFYFTLPGAKAKDRVVEKWGEGLKTVDLGRDKFLWFNPDKGLRASLSPGFGEDWNLEFTAYTPVKKFLGEGPGLAFEAPQALLGASVEQLRSAYPDTIVEKSQAEADLDRADLVAMVGEKAKVLGKAKPSVFLDLLPTEYEAYWTRVNLSFDDDYKVRRVRVSLPFELNPKAKGEMMSLFKAKWGEPKEGEKLGGVVYRFGDKGNIEVQEDSVSKGWDLVLLAPKG